MFCLSTQPSGGSALLFAALLFFFSFFLSSTAAPLEGPQRRQDPGSSTFVIGSTSGRNADGSVPFRLEIRELEKNADQWNLYLLGLERMQSLPQDDKLSWYQIAGIHGRPYRPWDSSFGAQTNTGYCTHSSILFLPWHRPYLALFEQVLYANIQFLVSDFPEGPTRDRYATAASTFRIPYWDWATASADGTTVLPDSIGGLQTVEVDSPAGRRSIPNPLFSYRFQELKPEELPNPPYSFWPTTLRYPTNSTIEAVSQNNLVAAQLQNSRLSLRDRLYNLLTSYPDFRNFSNKAWIPGDSGNYDSLESVHDQVHGLTGSGGNMGVVDYSAFDPIFFLHHTMIDRSFAIWQALYPDSWIEGEPSQFGTYTTPPGAMEDGTTGLTPFHSTRDGYYIADSVRDEKSLGYTYPELADWNVAPEQYRPNVRQAVNALYGSTAPASAISQRSLELESREAVNATNTTVALAADRSKVLLKDGQYREYIANLRVQKFALKTSFFIHVFLGDFGEQPQSWSFAPSLVGSHCVFVNADGPHDVQTGQEMASPDAQVTGTIPLTSALLGAVAAGNITSLDPEQVEPYLRRHLHWRVTTLEDVQVPRDQVADLKVSVVSSEVKKPGSASDFPTWGAVTIHYDITDSRPAGLSVGEPA